MNPQTGDIWYYRSDDPEYDDATVLIHEFVRETTGFSNNKLFVYFGYDMLEGEYGEYVFCETNMHEYWTRLS